MTVSELIDMLQATGYPDRQVYFYDRDMLREVKAAETESYEGSGPWIVLIKGGA